MITDAQARTIAHVHGERTSQTCDPADIIEARHCLWLDEMYVGWQSRSSGRAYYDRTRPRVVIEPDGMIA